MKDVSEEDIKHLHGLWKELVKSSRFDLAYVESAKGLKDYRERVKKLKTLKDIVAANNIKMKRLRENWLLLKERKTEP